MENRFRIEGFTNDHPVSVAWLLQATQGRLKQGNVNHVCRGITTDSRLVKPNDLFIPLKGDNIDGHKYLNGALNNGAVVILCAETSIAALANLNIKNDCAIILVKDTLRALGDIGHHWRQHFKIPIIAITGSNGKTTTKEISVALLKSRGDTLATWKNWNNLIGVPLTLLGLRAHHRYAVIEMGMNSFGEIKRLAEIADPTHRLITNVMAVHLEGVGSLEGVARAKGELIEGIGSEQTFIVNADDPYICRIAEKARCKKSTFSRSKKEAIDVCLMEVSNLEEHGFKGIMNLQGELLSFTFPLSGYHNLSNMLAAVALAHSLGIPHDSIINALKQSSSAEMRSEWVQLEDDIRIYNDCYNANPGSMRAALQTISQCTAKRHIAVLGDMWELGAQTANGHQEVLKTAQELHFDFTFCLGPNFQAASKELVSNLGIRCYTSIDALSQELGAMLRNGDLLVVKGSRGMQMERVTNHLKHLFGKEAQ